MLARIYRIAVTMAGLVAVHATTSLGGVVVASNDWDYAPVPNNWATSTYANATTSVPVTGGNTGHYLQVTFTSNDNQGAEFQIVRAPSSNFFVGAYGEDMYITFDFWASNTSPQSLQVYFQSSTNSNDYWLNVVDFVSSTGWATYGVSFTYSPSEWVGNDPGLSAEQYLSDLQSIGWIGIQIERSSTGEQMYGIDNFMLWVPEPGEWLLIITAVLACGYAERRRRLELQSAWAFQSSSGPPAPG